MSDALIIGGHGKVALLAAPKLIDHGFAVTSLIRKPEQAEDIEALGATPLVLDLAQLTPDEWDALLVRFDVVIWSAGAGGGAPGRTYAVDRDAALAVIDSLERLRDAGKAPRYLNVSYVGATKHSVPEDDSFFAYADSKKTVDDRLNGTEGLDYAILGPAALTLEPSNGWAPVDAAAENPEWSTETSRERGADGTPQRAARHTLPENRPVASIDGPNPVSEIG
ncbi:NAD(P)H-binding protein [Corynebacterium variabile]|uniref:NAD(P)H-binding protein n=1 Tax=Corynebacterium variabile TaxID=1727 RepID=UPI002649C6D1|nr:NAD(P)H-binding protein [Corynebacterium variabile]MDN6477972.1 NAD(P)H-binding protein [Corynebacterium variabile]